ncbi:MFS general substrate transporter [Mycena olivaceomarginata]|nr:MFS general substrate transporter [Mycena olivaceomarginata]
MAKTPFDETAAAAEGFPTISYTSSLDVAIDLAAGHADRLPVSAEDSRRCEPSSTGSVCMYTVQFIDKSTLSYTAVLGIIKDANLTIDDFNTLGSAFYIGYLVFQYPQNLALQYFPVGKWMTINLFLWYFGSSLGLHCVCHSLSSFCRRFATDIPLQWVATIIGGFLAFGAAHVAPTSKPNQWQVLYLITCLIPSSSASDNPTTARFLSEEEKILVVRRVQENQNGIETKKWKKDQFVECLKDYKTWMWFFWCAIANLQNGLGTESARVIKLFGFTTLQTTFLNIPSGVAQIIGITLGCCILRRFLSSICAYSCIEWPAWIHNIFFIPNILAALIQIFLPYSNKIGHLTAIYILNMGGGTSFVMMLSWVASATAGHTKKLATNGIFLIGYALGQTLCTQFWKAQYEPKFIVPWTICLASYAADIAIVTGLWFLLCAENARREALSAEKGGEAAAYHFGYLRTVDASGQEVKVKVEKGFLDLTDRQNLAFRYVL